MFNTEFYGAFSEGEFLHRGDLVRFSEPPRPETIDAPDPELVSGARLLATGRWREAHEAFEAAWRGTEGSPHTMFHALAQLAAALLKWSEERPEPAATLHAVWARPPSARGAAFAGVRVDVDALESTVVVRRSPLSCSHP
jgi:Domain of unknown function (DUF309)